jgi:hypothetical protein
VYWDLLVHLAFLDRQDHPELKARKEHKDPQDLKDLLAFQDQLDHQVLVILHYLVAVL